MARIHAIAPMIRRIRGAGVDRSDPPPGFGTRNRCATRCGPDKGRKAETEIDQAAFSSIEAMTTTDASLGS